MSARSGLLRTGGLSSLGAPTRGEYNVDANNDSLIHMTDALQHKLSQLPDKPGCYLFKDASGQVLYVGKAEVLRNRVRSYFQDSAAHSARIRIMVSRVADLETVVTDSAVEALLFECNLIKKHRPHFNVRLRDDKHYPYICLTMDEPFPRPIIVRRVKKDGNRYFGPYTSSWAMRQALRVIKSVFQLRGCARKIEEGDKQKLCLDYHLGLCSGPCAGMVERAEYLKAVHEVSLFLEGRSERALEKLTAEMEQAAEDLNFEAAARLRDQIQAIERVVERQKVLSTGLEDQDVVALVSDGVQTCAAVLQMRAGRLLGQERILLDGAHPDELSEATRQFVEQYYQKILQFPRHLLLSHDVESRDLLETWLTLRRDASPESTERARVRVSVPQKGEKRRLVELAATNARQHLEERKSQFAADQAKADQAMMELQEGLELPNLPYRIECYDISNTMGQESVGAMVVFEGGQPKKSDYRKFKIKTVEGPNDFASIQEMLRRRLQRGAEGDGKFAEMPDLIVIDGGKGQLSAAMEVERELAVEIPTVGLAKKYEEVFKPDRSQSILLPRNSQALFLLQRIRDEAHRFGLTFHRNLRSKRQTRSALDEIPGIGEKRRLALLKHFGSVDKMKLATQDELARAPGMNRPAAEKLFQSLRA
ncbi:MAG: excinuclease subunit [Armatimonadetes bacterium]|nr:excinuclease subunit [Armatimonadota bacterium]